MLYLQRLTKSIINNKKNLPYFKSVQEYTEVAQMAE